jgi:glutathione synthase/RimK-type ligase-like ATP-grasp enzyme
MNKSILVGKEGKASMAGVFASMKTPQNNLVVRGSNKKTSTDYFKLYNETDVEKFTRVKDVTFNDSIVIRWGTRVTIPETNCIVYNSNKALANSSNKFEARKLLYNASVRIPKLVTPDTFDMEDLPIIARPFQHKQGKDFIVIRDYGSFIEFYNRNSSSWYFSAYIEKDSEYRVHCAHGRILSIMRKPRPEDPTIMAWNHSVNEEAFEAVPWSEWNIDLCKTALRACKALGLDFAK